jgi:transposase InsO family protein
MNERMVAMETRLALAAHAVLEDSSLSVTAVCRTFGVSRTSYYTYKARLEADGLQGLLPRSSRPAHSPNQTGVEMVETLCLKHDELLAQGWDAGARSVHDWLVHAGVKQVPSARTIHKILLAHGRATPTPTKRPRNSYRRFEAMAPNGMWQLDGHETALADGTKAVVLRFLDDHSRMVMASRAAPSENGQDTWACMVSAMNRYGKPAVVLCDNGTAFTARFRRGGGYADFEVRLALIGVSMSNSSPGHPQTCGKKEREWQTLDKWLRARAKPETLQDLQVLLDTYDTLYNTQRPHQALGGVTPQERYDASDKAVPDPETLRTRVTLHHRKLSDTGGVDLPNLRVSFGRRWAGMTISYLIDFHQAVFFLDSEPLGRVDLDRARYIGLPKTPLTYHRITVERTHHCPEPPFTDCPERPFT